MCGVYAGYMKERFIKEVIMRKRQYAVLLAAGLLCSSVLGNTAAHADTFQETGKIWVIGDSISSDHNDEDNLKDNKVPITGWGNVLQNYLGEQAKIENKARSGRSSQSYTRETVYKEVQRGIQAGDYVIIQFGHNDSHADNKGLYTDPAGDSSTQGAFKWYLKMSYIDPFIEKGAKVILASSVVRYTFEDGKRGEQEHAAYAKAMKELAEEYQSQGDQVYFIDTYEITDQMYEELGEEGAAKLHAVLGQDPDTKLDTTHYGPYGAMRIAGIMAKELKALGLDCCKEIKQAKTMDQAAANRARTDAKKFAWR